MRVTLSGPARVQSLICDLQQLRGEDGYSSKIFQKTCGFLHTIQSGCAIEFLGIAMLICYLQLSRVGCAIVISSFAMRARSVFLPRLSAFLWSILQELPDWHGLITRKTTIWRSQRRRTSPMIGESRLQQSNWSNKF